MPPRARWAVAALAVVAATAPGGARVGADPGRFGSTGSAPAGGPAPPPALAFASSRSGNFEIYTSRADGTRTRRLTHNPAADTGPSWSPDGTKIVFQSSRSGAGDLYVIARNGTGLRRLVGGPAFDGDPAWSPNGKTI